MKGRRPSPLLALVWALVVASAWAEPTPTPTKTPVDEAASLRDYSYQLFKELEQTRAALAASEKERANMQKLLDSTAQELRAEIANRQALYAKETLRREEEVRSAKQEMKQLEGEVAAAEKARRDAAAKQAATLVERERELQQLSDQLSHSKQDRDERTKELQAQQARLEAAQHELAAVQKDREKANETVKQLDGQIGELHALAADHEKAKKRLEYQLADLAETREAQAKTDAAALSERSEEISELTRRIDSTEQEASEREETLKRQALELESTRTRLLEASATQAQQSQDTLEARERELEALRSDLEKTQQSSAERLKELEKRAKDLDSARKQLESLQRDTEERKNKAVELQRQVADLRTKASQQEVEQRAKEEQSRAEIVDLRTKASEEEAARRAKEEQSRAEIADLRTKSEAEQRAKDEQIAKLSTRAANLEEELVKFRAASEASAGAAERVEREQTNVSAELAGLSQRGDKAALADRAVLQKKLGDLKQEGREIGADRRDQQKRIAALERQLAEVKETSKSKLEALESVLKHTRSAGADLRAQLDEARTRNTELSGQLADLKGNVAKVRDLRTNLERTKLRLNDLKHTKNPDPAEVDSLRSLQQSLEVDLRDAKSAQLTTASSLTVLLKTLRPDRYGEPPAAHEPVSETSIEGEDSGEGGDVREQLTLERERRQTLEEEVQRLTSSGNNEERYVELWNTLQSARSEIFVLSNQLAEERQAREQFEIALERLKEQGGGGTKSSSEFAKRLADTLKDRRAQADRLGEELKTATETIVRLKGRLEASGSPMAESKVLADLDKENRTLRTSLTKAEEVKKALQQKADMAERLAEMLYGKFP